MTKDKARALLHGAGLRVTAPRVAVLRILAASARPLSHTEVVEALGRDDWDPATLYRNLIKLREAGLAPVVSRADGLDRYAFASPESDGHQHPHFVCEDCGKIACLPSTVSASISVEGPWAASVKAAAVQLRGECPDCLTVVG